MTRANAEPLNVVVIDNDSGFDAVLANRLEQAGWRYSFVAAAPPISEIAAMRLHAVVVDPTVLGASAWQFLEELCEALPMLGVLVCTRQSTVAQRVRGLRLGVDDWIAKPCHPEEVVARIGSIARKHRRAGLEQAAEAGPLVTGELEFRLDRYEIMVGSRPVDLTKREFELLLLLAQSDGRVLPREQIYQRVWGYAMAHGDRSVDVFVRKLRHKLDAASPGWSYIHTHFGIGYRFDPEPVDGSVGDATAIVAPVEAVELPTLRSRVGVSSTES